MKKSFLFIFFAMIFHSCSNDENGKLEQKIEESISKSCNSQICKINLSKITTFKWAKFFVFKETASLEIIEKEINQKYPYFEDIARRLIFLDEKNKIVFHEDIFPNIEGVSNNDVIFSMDDTLNFRVYSNPNFIVTKEKIQGGYYYVLNQ